MCIVGKHVEGPRSFIGVHLGLAIEAVGDRGSFTREVDGGMLAEGAGAEGGGVVRIDRFRTVPAGVC